MYSNQAARDSMRNLMWHQYQKALSDFVIAILDEPRTCTWIRLHRPCWPNGRSEPLSLSLPLKSSGSLACADLMNMIGTEPLEAPD